MTTNSMEFFAKRMSWPINRARPFADSMTMVGRNLLHAWRYPMMTVGVLMVPLIMLLLFGYVFGNSMRTSIGASSTSGEYISYLTPAILLLALAGGSMATSVAIASDMQEGIIARFRTMSIFRPSILFGHVVGSMVQNLVAIMLLIGVSLLVGFRPGASPVEWVAALGLMTLIAFALTWISVALGIVSKSVEGASNITLPFQMQLFLSTAFTPAESIPSGIRWFAEYQPFTPALDTIRGLLLGQEIGNSWIAAIAWFGGLAIVGYWWAMRAYERATVQ